MTLPQSPTDSISILSRFRGRLPESIKQELETRLIKEINRRTPIIPLGFQEKSYKIPPPLIGDLDIEKSISSYEPFLIPTKTPILEVQDTTQPHICIGIDESLSVSTHTKYLQYYICSLLLKSWKHLTILGYSTNYRVIGRSVSPISKNMKQLLDPPPPAYTNLSAPIRYVYRQKELKLAIFITEGSHNIGIPPKGILRKNIPIHIIDVHHDLQLRYISKYTNGLYFPIPKQALPQPFTIHRIIQSILT